MDTIGERQLLDPTVTWLAREQNITRVDAARRLTWQLLVEDVTDLAVFWFGPRFGGIWIDDAEGGRIKIGVTGSTAQDRTQLDSHELSAVADVVSISRSLAELENAADWLWSRALTLNHAVVMQNRKWTIAVAITPSNSGAVLYVPPVSHQTEEQRLFIAEALSTLGSMVSVEEYEYPPRPAVCNTTLPPYCDPPLRAGIAINHPFECTGGFPARSRSDGKLYQFTAGHCTRNRTSSWTTRFSGGSVHVIGAVHNCEAGRGPSNNCRQGGGDYAIIRVNNPSGWQQSRGWVFVRASGSNGGVSGTTRDARYPIRRSSTLPANWEGMRICKSGRSAAATSCGKVIAIGRGYTDQDGYSYTGLAITSFCTLPGDSGGPVYAMNTAYGIAQGTSGLNPCRSWYQGIVGAQDGMNVNIVLAP